MLLDLLVVFISGQESSHHAATVWVWFSVSLTLQRSSWSSSEVAVSISAGNLWILDWSACVRKGAPFLIALTSFSIFELTRKKVKLFLDFPDLLEVLFHGK